MKKKNIHYKVAAWQGACGGNVTPKTLTKDKTLVTCPNCLRTKVFKSAK